MNTKSYVYKTQGNAQLSLFPAEKKEQVIPEVLHQYLFLISPPESIKSKVKSLKHVLHQSFGLSKNNLHSIPHISLLSFHSARPVNDHFLSVVRQVFSKTSAFQINLKGYGAFHHSGSTTLYVNVNDSSHLSMMYKDLTGILGFPAKSFVPHLTVARTISNSDFETANVLVNKHLLEDEFTCSQISILERKFQNGIVSNYKVISNINLNY